MISYYQNKNPGLYIYIALLCISVSVLLFIDTTPKLIGFFSIIWGSFLTMRTLSLYEVSEHFQVFANHKHASKTTNQSASALAHDLNRRKRAHNHMLRGLSALNSIKLKSFIWIGLGILYCASHIIWNYQSTNTQDIASHICLTFILGSIFWCGQTYAYSDKASRLILRAVSALFLITLITHFYSFNTAITLNSSNMLVALIILYSGACMLYALKNNNNKKSNALLGLALLTILVFYSSYPLWICGLSLFSICWIRAYKNTKKKYILYQCE